VAHDNEVRLISRAIRDRNITPLLDVGVDASWWNNPSVKDVWVWMVKHWTKYSEVPTPTTVKAEFPTFTLLNVQDTLDYLLDKFVEYRRHVAVTDTVQQAAEILSSTNDHEAAKDFIAAALMEIDRSGVPGISDINLMNDPLLRLAEYEEVEKRGGALLGLPTGFEKIDEATAGLQPGQLVTIIATPKVGKSTLALQAAVNMHEQGHGVMLQSFEMSNVEQQVRHDAMRAKIAHDRLRRGRLTTAEKQQYRVMLTRTAALTHPLTLVDSVHGITVSALTAQIEKHKPPIAIVDGVYLMMDEQTGEANTPQAITNITRSLKRLAQRSKIPIVISTQTLPWKTKNGKVSADAIGYSSSFFQDSDVILGLQRVDGNDEVRELLVVESRNCGRESVTLVWRWDTGCFHEDTPSMRASCQGCKIAARYGPQHP
jgi:replicative DNA helicase